VVRSERLIKLRDSWFSAKSILVERLNFFFWGRALDKQWGVKALTEFIETSNTK
jgi:hypothetical protein